MKTLVHAIAGTVALLCVVAFLTSTVIAELVFDHSTVAAVKDAIAKGLLVLIPALIVTGGSGFALSKQLTGRLVENKKRRMPFIALNGLLVLLPAALYLDAKASAGEFDLLFYSVQAVELLFGGLQLVLLSLNFRSGLRLSGRMRTAARAQ